MEEPSIPPQQRNNNLQVSSSGDSCCLIYDLIWAVVYWTALSNPDFQECPEPVYFWGIYGKCYYTTSIIVSGICLFCLAPIFLMCSQNVKIVGIFSVLLVNTIIRLSGFVLTIGIFISFPHRAECHPLTTVITVEFVFSLIFIALLTLACCCLILCCVALTSEGSGQQRNRRRPAMNILQGAFPIFRLFQSNQSYANMP